jgi:hypothetical protein
MARVLRQIVYRRGRRTDHFVAACAAASRRTITADRGPSASMREWRIMLLKDRVAIVTGSTSGIGLGIATAIAAEGCSVMLNGFGDAAAIEGAARSTGL